MAPCNGAGATTRMSCVLDTASAEAVRGLWVRDASFRSWRKLNWLRLDLTDRAPREG